MCLLGSEGKIELPDSYNHVTVVRSFLIKFKTKLGNASSMLSIGSTMGEYLAFEHVDTVSLKAYFGSTTLVEIDKTMYWDELKHVKASVLVYGI